MVFDRLLEERAPNPFRRNPIGFGMAAPALMAHGTARQRTRLLRPLFTGEEIWCQLFSEPGAGSDIAALSARARRDGAEWIISGQKVWTSFAHGARRGLLLARHDPNLSKHHGLTFFLLDMASPGVDVRPLRQITGEAEFNEVFLDEVRVPDADRLGAVGQGWAVAMTVLSNERASIGGAAPGRTNGPIRSAIRLWQKTGSRDPIRRDHLTRLWIQSEVNRLTSVRAGQLRRAGLPGPDGSLTKLASSEASQMTYECCMSILGADAMLYGSYDMHQPDAGTSVDSVQKAFLRSRAHSIEGGTSEILRNLIAERVLGLPPEPRVDKGVPWNDLNRS